MSKKIENYKRPYIHALKEIANLMNLGLCQSDVDWLGILMTKLRLQMDADVKELEYLEEDNGGILTSEEKKDEED